MLINPLEDGVYTLVKKSLFFLIWEAIKFASTVSKKFDLEGSMLEPVERFFRGFGTVQKPYFTISKTFDKRMKAAYIFRDMVNLLRGR